MARGRSFMDLKGKVFLADPMIATQWKGMLVVKGYPNEHHVTISEPVARHLSAVASLTPRWRVLTKYQRDGWEEYASGLGSAYKQGKRFVSGGSGNIIRSHRGVLMGGVHAYISRNLLAHSVDWKIPRDEAPLGISTPPSPLIKSAIYIPEDKVIEMEIEEPNFAMDYEERKIRVWVEVCYRYTFGARIIGLVDIPQSGAFRFGKVRAGRRVSGFDEIELQDIDSGFVRIQCDVVVAYKPEFGAIASAGSNVAEVVIPNQPKTEKMLKVLENIRNYRNETKRRYWRRRRILKQLGKFLEMEEEKVK